MTPLARHELNLVRDWCQDHPNDPLATAFRGATDFLACLLDADHDGCSVYADAVLRALQRNSHGRHGELVGAIRGATRERDRQAHFILAEIDRTANGKPKRR